MELVENKVRIKSLKRANYISIISYMKRNFIYLDLPTQIKIGKLAKKICQEKEFPVKSIAHLRFGSINQYPFFVLEIAFRQMNIKPGT